MLCCSFGRGLLRALPRHSLLSGDAKSPLCSSPTLRARRLVLAVCAPALLLSIAACRQTEEATDTTPDAPNTGPGTTPEVVHLQQGWSSATRDQAQFASFGSRIIPYDWLLHLEQADNAAPFLAAAHMDELGFLSAPASEHNPDALPVGFAKDVDDNGVAWAGLGCAACHTAEVRYQGKSIRIDGGSALINYSGLEFAIRDSVQATLAQPEKFSRFAKALSAESEAQLKAALQQRLDYFTERFAMNSTEVPYGRGRLDAFGQIFNVVTSEITHQPENRRSPDAPVSFPVLWGTPRMDLVQWNGSASNAAPGPLAQNVTTALAVYGAATVDGHSELPGYPSSVNFGNLGDIQKRNEALLAPKWPESILGKLDTQRVEQGRSLYAERCLSCHTLTDHNAPDAKINVALTPLDEVGTDPKMAMNFLLASAQSGPYQGRKLMVFGGAALGATEPSIKLVIHAAIGAIVRHPIAATLDVAEASHPSGKPSATAIPRYYKGRPLDGVWSSAPYLHNGSVPNLQSLLSPPEQRPQTFYVGDREFDPVKVGASTQQVPGATLFDTRLPGNSNAGHVFGVDLSADEKQALLEYLKSL
ncbi:di-heme-cytochrome C peroxidase [Hahella sp. NBU794]|uniref:di-heme-cytochrome C peroxidase n=1 Tax=Hahella sp. NBU794 TaxID=3422590 RepID=UPI003D6E6D49